MFAYVHHAYVYQYFRFPPWSICVCVLVIVASTLSKIPPVDIAPVCVVSCFLFWRRGCIEEVGAQLHFHGVLSGPSKNTPEWHPERSHSHTFVNDPLTWLTSTWYSGGSKGARPAPSCEGSHRTSGRPGPPHGRHVRHVRRGGTTAHGGVPPAGKPYERQVR